MYRFKVKVLDRSLVHQMLTHVASGYLKQPRLSSSMPFETCRCGPTVLTVSFRSPDFRYLGLRMLSPYREESTTSRPKAETAKTGHPLNGRKGSPNQPF
jgi:hypothetical protein